MPNESGLLDKGESSAPASVSESVALPVWARPKPLHAVRDLVVITLVLVFPFAAGNAYWERVATVIMIYALLTIGLNVVTGYTGMLSLGHASFFGIGAYTSAILAMRVELPWPLCLLGAAALTGAVSLLLALPTLRLQSDFLGLVTLAFGSFCTVLALNWVSLTGGPSGLPGVPNPRIGPLEIATGHQYYILIAVFLIVVYLVMRRVEASTVGRAWRAIRDDSMSAAAMGINVARYKILSFVVAGVIAGIAGSLFGSYLSLVSPTSFNLMQSLLIVEMVIIGGLGSLPGAVVGAAIFIILPEVFRSFEVYQDAFGGSLMVLAMIFRPQGLLGKTAFGQSMQKGRIGRWWWRTRQGLLDHLLGLVRRRSGRREIR